MNIFEFRDRLIHDYAEYVKSFFLIKDPTIHAYIEQQLEEGLLWPEPLIQLNPFFEPGGYTSGLVDQQILHPECRKIFQRNKDKETGSGQPLRLHRHQTEAIQIAQQGVNYVLTTGTGSGKSLAYIIPIVNHVLQNGSGRGIQAIIIYPMNALANSQFGELEKFLCRGYPDGPPVTFDSYTGQLKNEERQKIITNPPDILLTNYVMLELMMTRTEEQRLIDAAKGLKFLVLDELHTYRGRQGADVALLIRRVRDRLETHHLQCVGTSATMASGGSFAEQQRQVAHVAGKLFGAEVKAEHVIGETLQPITREQDVSDPEFVHTLRDRIADPTRKPPITYHEFVDDPLSIWLEQTFGITKEPGSERLVRCIPQTITGDKGTAKCLHDVTGIPEERCKESIEEGLLAGYACEPHPETGFAPFAFRLHQFIGRGDTIYTTLGPEEERYVTAEGQQFQPGDRSKVLLPLAFCRECGQEYYTVWVIEDEGSEKRFVTPRTMREYSDDDRKIPGFLYFSSESPWPESSDEILTRLPDDWLDEVGKIRQARKKELPQPLRLALDGSESSDGLRFQVILKSFKFCLNCGVSYESRQKSEFAKLATLSSEGRSTATTILALSAITHLKAYPDIPEKLLSFTDNRQDASLQAGHFNDFVEIALLRSALYKAVNKAGPEGLSHDELTQKVFTALNLPLTAYASDPGVQYQALKDTQRALREVLGYRLYLDLRRGWRITTPNLEQCGLLAINYFSLDEICHDQVKWENCHRILASASPETRERIAKVLLDYMRRELAIKVDYLDSDYQERIQQRSNQRLIPPWGVDENERMIHASILFPRPRRKNEKEYRGYTYLSARGGFGRYLRQHNTFDQWTEKLSLAETQRIIVELLENLRVAGIVERVIEPNETDSAAGYQLVAAAIQWNAGDGTRAYHDPIRVPNIPESGGKTNTFFVEFYRAQAAKLAGIEAREHTAQVQNEERQKRENKFRSGELPILFCSPTMELGIDIADLNVVNMRNVPPSPANYAQRSGRAGRSGQPALVFTYCTNGSPHDQYFFKRPEDMVAGAVMTPRIDLTNKDLIRSHIQAIWLAETGLSLGTALPEIVKLEADNLELPLQDFVRAATDDPHARRRAQARALNVLDMIKMELDTEDWDREQWVQTILNHIPHEFDRTCERWRTLYRAAFRQAETQGQIVLDPSRTADEKKQAKLLRDQAEEQLQLLTEVRNVVQSDFYSYRYFASEGFLPGYNFPRLPLSAYIPGRRNRQGSNDYVSRPRFLAISEFGPQTSIYHEGSRYVVNQVILPAEQETLITNQAKICKSCGYLHEDVSRDRCEHCHAQLNIPLQHLFRLQNVATRRRDRINCDEEERTRMGYDIITTVRFQSDNGHIACQSALIYCDEKPLFHLTYGEAATLWRINLGWRRRKNEQDYGFVLDTERGFWQKQEATITDEEDVADPMSARREKVIPYVTDRRNCLLLRPEQSLTLEQMATLQAALKSAIQVCFQLEDNELAVEPLPDSHTRRILLIYESAEGGAGVLKRLLDESDAVQKVARAALEVCHFDPDTGADRRRAPRAKEDCEAACYNCLMSYYNQRDHRSLDRSTIRDLLLELRDAQVIVSPTSSNREDHFQTLLPQCDSDLERQWLQLLEQYSLHLPTDAQKFIEQCRTRPDFFYDTDAQAAIYVDGPPHDFVDRQHRDSEQEECMEDHGYTVIRFHHQEDWLAKIDQYPDVFGKRTE